MERKAPREYVGYWDTYYTKKLAPEHASGFAQFVLTYMRPGRELIDLGCGNGRDSLFFARRGLRITALDNSQAAIDAVNRDRGDLPVRTVKDDFVNSEALLSTEFDYCYSRWTMHIIDDSQQAVLLKNVWSSLKEGGLFFVEARTVGDDIYGLGQEAGPHAFIYNEHYRRFLQPEAFSEQLRMQGFEILHLEEGRGFSKTEESDPVLLRVVAEKCGG